MYAKPSFYALVLAALCLLPGAVFSDTLLITADTWCPYNCDPEALNPGYGIEILKRIFEPLGHKVEYQTVPWARAVAMVMDGKCTGIIGALKGDCPECIFPEEEIGVNKNGFFVKSESTWKYNTLDSLEKINKFSIVKGYSYGKSIDAYIADKSHESKIEIIVGEEPEKDYMPKLLKGRIDAVLENENVFKMKAASMNVQDRVKAAGFDREIENIYVAFSPQNPKSKEYAEIFTKGIRELAKNSKDGKSGQKDKAGGRNEIAKIMKKYKISYWK
ncbi:MAG: transporter substrate-binding domain-containing protein [Oligoflexales bacterium]|nr:transporter substrate-binding domain-containing protein [Oligoflexales bacterium]